MRHSSVILLLLGVCMFPMGFALPANYAETELYRQEHCLRMTPEKEAKISEIVIKLSEFLYNLALEYQGFDISLAKVIIDRHLDIDDEITESQVQLIVNDCDDVDDSIERNAEPAEFISRSDDDDELDQQLAGTLELDFSDEEDSIQSRRKIVTSVYENKEKTDDDALVEYNEDSIPSDDENTEKSDDTALVEYNEDQPVEELSLSSDVANIPQVFLLNLDENLRKLIASYEKKRGKTPLVLYIQKLLDQNLSYLFL